MTRADRLRLGASLIALGTAMAAPAARAQEVLLNGVPVAGSPMVVTQVAVPDNGVLSLDPGTSITTAVDAVIDLADGTTITVNNLGTITSTGAAAIDATSSTLFLTNGGTITGNIDGVIAGIITSLENSGTITGTIGDGVFANTITSLVNAGTITGGFEGVLANTITSLVNSGTITGNFGVRAGPITSLENSGTITGGNTGVIAATITSLENSGTITGGNFGVNAFTITSLVNAGTIIGGSGTAIKEAGAANTLLTLLPGSNIQGLVDLGGGVNTLVVGNGLSMATTFATVPNVIDTSGAPFAVSGTTVHVVDPTGFALADAMLADTTGAISDVLASQFGGPANGAVAVAMGNATSLTVTPAAGTAGPTRAWAEAFGGWKDRDADKPTVASDHVFAGVMAGFDTTVGEATRAGLFVGGAEGRADVDFDAQEIDTESVFAGLYASHQAGTLRLDAAVTAGLADYDSDRFLANNLAPGGIQVAKADYDGVFVSPELTVSTDMAMGEMTVRPSLRLRYAGLWLDDYTETGSASNLTVDDRSVHILEARAQVAIPMTVMANEHGTATTELRVGVDARTSLGSDNVDAVLVGQNISFDPGGEDEVLTGFAAAAFALRATNGVTVTGSVEGGYATDDTAHVAARMGARVDF